jgi:urease accessory protein
MPQPLSLPLFAFTLLALALAPGMALAHVGHGSTNGFVSGFLHPIGGLDHILAMTAVGLFAWTLGGRALWAVPLAFVAAMALGGALGMAGLGLPLVEIGITLSIVVIGALVAFRLKLPTVLAMTIVGVFAIFHGHAHGTEMAPGASGLGYGIGFVVATALLHGAGILAGMGLGRLATGGGIPLARASGAVIAMAGILILADLL